MAIYPTAIRWDKSSTKGRRTGIGVVEMTDGSPHVQTFFSQDSVEFRVKHKLLTQAELDTVLDFLAANVGLDIDLIEPASGNAYRGKQVGDVSMPYDGDVHHAVSWDFKGKKL